MDQFNNPKRPFEGNQIQTIAELDQLSRVLDEFPDGSIDTSDLVYKIRLSNTTDIRRPRR
jgi:hypothetical protein